MALPAIADVRRHFAPAPLIVAARRECRRSVPHGSRRRRRDVLEWNGAWWRRRALNGDAIRLRETGAATAILLPNSFCQRAARHTSGRCGHLGLRDPICERACCRARCRGRRPRCTRGTTTSTSYGSSESRPDRWSPSCRFPRLQSLTRERLLRRSWMGLRQPTDRAGAGRGVREGQAVDSLARGAAGDGSQPRSSCHVRAGGQPRRRGNNRRDSCRRAPRLSVAGSRSRRNDDAPRARRDIEPVAHLCRRTIPARCTLLPLPACPSSPFSDRPTSARRVRWHAATCGRKC